MGLNYNNEILRILYRIYLKKIRGIKNPYTKYDDKYKCIFIHIPKAAGISISKSLFGVNIGHRIITYFKIFNKKKFEKYFKFTFVRNPWSRFVSAFSFLKNGGRNEVDKKWADKFLKKYDRIDEFIKDLNDKKFCNKILKEQHFRPQYKFVADRNKDILVDYVGKVENIEDDFLYIINKLGINTKLLFLNKSSHDDYRKYYTKKTSRIIEDIYKTDIELFNYNFRGENEK